MGDYRSSGGMLPHVRNLFLVALNFLLHFAELRKALPPADWLPEGDGPIYKAGRSGTVATAPSGRLEK